MKYYIDTEFIEGFRKPLIGKRSHFIDLISIGIVAEDGRKYYAVSKEFNPKEADDWVKKNVLKPLEVELFQKQPVFAKSMYDFKLPQLLRMYGKSNKQIMLEIVEFVCPINVASEWAGVGSLSWGMQGYLESNPPEFYGYYSDYDWVLFCSLFGRMIDLPKGFPMYCRDLKQMLDEKAENYIDRLMTGTESFEWRLEALKNKANYPKQKNEHNALADAEWNKRLHDFINTLPK